MQHFAALVRQTKHSTNSQHPTEAWQATGAVKMPMDMQLQQQLYLELCSKHSKSLADRPVEWQQQQFQEEPKLHEIYIWTRWQDCSIDCIKHLTSKVSRLAAHP